MTAEPKRCWERKHGSLIDRWVDGDGVCGVTYSAEPVADDDDHRGRLARIAAGTPGALRALHDEESPEHLDALLAGIGAGSTPDMTLLRYADDPRVRPAVVRSVERLEVGDAGLGNSLQVLGYLGGRGALTALRTKANALSELTATWQDHDFHNQYAGILKTACDGILRLDPEAVDAARLLVRLCEHRCRSNRSRALLSAGEWLRIGAPSTAATQMLRRTVLDAAAHDDDAFLAAAPALRWTADDFEERAVQVLESRTEREDRDQVAYALSRLTPPVPGRVALALRRLVEQETDLREAVHLVGVSGALVTEETLVRLATGALAAASPSLRTDGCLVLTYLAAEVARGIAVAALVDEPDPVLVAKLRRFA